MDKQDKKKDIKKDMKVQTVIDSFKSDSKNFDPQGSYLGSDTGNPNETQPVQDADDL